jgi:Zn-dependent M28 family amino/carboxypeptidase
MQGQGTGRLMSVEQAQQHTVPALLVVSDELQKWTEHPPDAANPPEVSVKIPAPEDRRVTLKNVIGVLRGSDPKLKSTCVLLTAHYDHIGTSETGSRMSPNRSQNSNDHIYNGANDDGSGTVSVIEIAGALAQLNPRPKRSLVFMTFFGEERGELGSQFYGKHPIFPIGQTIADLNLEQVGRTDSTTGPQIKTASLTGFDYSDVPKYMEEAGRETGVKVYLDKEASDAYFTRSDNAALAEQGVPAHSLTVAFDYPDYHGLGDEWQKIDYENMAEVDRMIALGLLHLADSWKAPEWNAQNPKAAPFRAAQAKVRNH